MFQSQSSRYPSEFRGFGRHACIEFVPRNDEAFVTAFADEIDAVMRLYLESDALTGDFDALGFRRHRHAGRCRREMAHIDVHADAALARIEMLLDKIGARP